VKCGIGNNCRKCIEEHESIEEDLENVEKKCEKISCLAIYDALIATIKLIYDLLFCCCKRKINLKPLKNFNN
jgi:hypothetical protein